MQPPHDSLAEALRRGDFAAHDAAAAWRRVTVPEHQASLCKVLTNALAEAPPQAALAVHAAGLTHAVLETLTAHGRTHARCAAAACMALANIAIGATHHVQGLGARGGSGGDAVLAVVGAPDALRLVCATLRAHAGDAQVAQYACHALMNATSADERGPTPDAPAALARAPALADALDAAHSALRRHAASGGVAMSACGALRNVLCAALHAAAPQQLTPLNEQTASQLAEDGAAALRAHAADADVALQASWLLTELLHERGGDSSARNAAAAAAAAGRAGAVDALAAALAAHGAPGSQHAVLACMALRRLSCCYIRWLRGGPSVSDAAAARAAVAVMAHLQRAAAAAAPPRSEDCFALFEAVNALGCMVVWRPVCGEEARDRGVAALLPRLDTARRAAAAQTSAAERTLATDALHRLRRALLVRCAACDAQADDDDGSGGGGGGGGDGAPAVPLRRLKTCARCHGAAYCSAACQRAHWPQHKRVCAAAAAAAVAANE
jgi:hypothetical protein